MKTEEVTSYELVAQVWKKLDCKSRYAMPNKKNYMNTIDLGEFDSGLIRQVLSPKRSLCCRLEMLSRT